MSSRRPVIAGISTLAVIVGSALVATPSSASTGSIYVAGSTHLSILALTEVAMGEEEFLQILETDRTKGTYTVRIWNESLGDDGGLGRPLLIGDSGCAPTGVATAELLCTLPPTLTFVYADLTATSGPTNLAIMDEAPISLEFRGSSGVDYVQGGSANDTLWGLGGDDVLFGGPGDDILSGGPGDDYLEGETGSDRMIGGTGSNSLDAADGFADISVDCGGAPAFLDFDEGKDVVTNCGENPSPVPPAPVEPTDPPEPGEGDGTVDGVPTDVEVGPNGDDTKSVTISTGPQNPLFQSQLWWFGTPSTPPVPTFPPFPTFDMTISQLWPGSIFELSIFSGPSPPPFGCEGPCVAVASEQRSGAVATESYTADANGVVRAAVPIPEGLAAGDYTLQFNGVTASSAQMTINVGVRLNQATPEPEPQPEEAITLTSAKRGKGKKAAVITIRGTAVGLSGTSVTLRYRVKGAKKWKTAEPVMVSDSGAFRWKVTTRKQVTVQVRSGAVTSNTVKVAAAKRR